LHAQLTVTPAQLPEVLLNTAVVRPVFLWGAPGIGKSSLVREFAASLGLECVSLLGTQLAPEDLALARPMASALVNRLVHVHLRAAAGDWLVWAAGNGIHPWVVEYLTQRPDHLWSPPPKTEEPFSTPRSWHMLSDLLHSYGDPDGDETIALLAYATLTPAHAGAFRAYLKVARHAFDLEAILKGDARWPAEPGDRDLLYFLAETFRARLVKDLPADKRHASATVRQFAFRAKGLLVELAEISLEMAQLVIADDEAGHPRLPSWFLVEAARDLPRLVAARA
jgi:hypothetical protein